MLTDGTYARAALMAYSMLVELCTHCDITMAFKQLRCRPVYATPLRREDSHAMSALGGTGGAVDGAPDGAGGGMQRSRMAEGALAPASVFQVPGMHMLPSLLLERVGLKELHEAPDDERRVELVRLLQSARQFDCVKELRRFAPHFNPHYCVRRSFPMGSRFTAGEEKLLALGLRRYGFTGLDFIRAALLAPKSKEQLQNHYARQTRRRVIPDNPDNPIPKRS